MKHWCPFHNIRNGGFPKPCYTPGVPSRRERLQSPESLGKEAMSNFARDIERSMKQQVESAYRQRASEMVNAERISKTYGTRIVLDVQPMRW